MLRTKRIKIGFILAAVTLCLFGPMGMIVPEPVQATTTSQEFHIGTEWWFLNSRTEYYIRVITGSVGGEIFYQQIYLYAIPSGWFPAAPCAEAYVHTSGYYRWRAWSPELTHHGPYLARISGWDAPNYYDFLTFDPGNPPYLSSQSHSYVRIDWYINRLMDPDTWGSIYYSFSA